MYVRTMYLYMYHTYSRRKLKINQLPFSLVKRPFLSSFNNRKNFYVISIYRICIGTNKNSALAYNIYEYYMWLYIYMYMYKKYMGAFKKMYSFVVHMDV